MEEKLILQNLQQHLTKQVSPKSLALALRRLKLEVVRLVLAADPDTFDRDWITDGLYEIDALSEVLDPYLDKQD